MHSDVIALGLDLRPLGLNAGLGLEVDLKKVSK